MFVHIPKTGGNSIQNVLREYSEDDIVVIGKYQDGVERFEVKNKNYEITKHSTLSHYSSVLEPSLFRRLFKFGTIRNPWDMMISFYFSPNLGATEWRRKDFIKLIQNVAPIQHYISLTSSFEKKLNKLRLPIRLVGSSIDVDFLIRFENLQNDFNYVCDKIGIQHTILPHRNASSRGHYSKYYDDELIDLVAKHFSEEIRIGGYQFENSDT